MVVLKNVLWVPGLPCRLLSTGVIRREGGEYVDSSLQKSYIRLKHGAHKIMLEEKKGFLTLSGRIRVKENKQASAQASFANRKERLTLKDWHNVLGHIDPAAIKHIEKRGLIEVTDTTVASDMRCAVCRACKSQALSYGRGGRSPKAPRGHSHRSGGTFPPGCNRHEVLSGLRG